MPRRPDRRLTGETPSQMLASALLGEPVMPWLQRRRDEGMTLTELATALRDATRGSVDLTYAGIDYWFRRAGADNAGPPPAAPPTSETA